MQQRIRLLQESDIPAAMRLKNAAGWNQVEDDWRIFLKLAPGGCFGLDCDGKVVATSTALPYGQERERGFGWIGMVLVDVEYRRRGLGTSLFLHAVGHLESRGLTPLLDATCEGRLVYDQHGFERVYELERWAGTARGTSSSRGVRRLDADSADELERLAALDVEHFGASRRELLEEFAHRTPELAFIAESESTSDGGIGGYLLGRRGTRFVHFGPGVARDPGVGQRLLDHALHVAQGEPVCVDIPRQRIDLRDYLAVQGLEVHRPLIRMVRRNADAPGAGETRLGGDPRSMVASAGPEWG